MLWQYLPIAVLDWQGHIAKMICNAIEVCDENRDSPTSNQLQDILDKTLQMVPLRSVTGVQEYRMIQLLDDHC